MTTKRKAVAPAWKEFQEAIAKAISAFEEAIAPAWKEFQEAIAKAISSYEEATK